MRLLLRDTGKGINCLFSFASFLPPVTIALPLWQVTQVGQYIHMDTDMCIPVAAGSRQLLCAQTGECAVPTGALGSAALAFLACQCQKQRSSRRANELGRLGPCIPSDKHH